MDIKPILDAARGVELALTKFTQVLQTYNDNMIHQNNDANLATTVAPTAPGASVTADAVATTTVPATSGVELDDEGVPHDKRIHSDTPSKVNSKEVKGGKAWRRRKNLDDAYYEQIKAEIRQGTAATAAPETPAATEAAPAPSLPGLPGAPAAPSTTAPPAVPASPVNDEVRRECIAIIKQLTDTHGLTFEDCKEILVEEFKVAQSGDAVSFDAVKADQFEAVRDYFASVRDKYETAENYVAEIRKIAGAANAPTIDAGLTSILSNFNTEVIGGVHYSQVDQLNETLGAWHKQYVDWAAQQ